MKKIIAIILVAVMCLCVPAFADYEEVFVDTEPLDVGGSLSNFARSKQYTEGRFTDVSAGVWYAESVKAAYELGLVNGNSETTFNPEGSITLAETITLAARLRATYETGKNEFAQTGDVWYQVYVDYALNKGIIYDGQFSDYTKAATRAEFAVIMKNAVPRSALPAINNVEYGQIPDVPIATSYSMSVYLLYNAGILTGNDELGTFAPDTTIARSAVAAIVTRIADASLRRSVTLQ